MGIKMALGDRPRCGGVLKFPPSLRARYVICCRKIIGHGEKKRRSIWLKGDKKFLVGVIYIPVRTAAL